MSQPAYAVSWYASVGNWEIDRHSESMSFLMDDYYQGNISAIEATPRGMKINGSHSRYVNIDLNHVGIKGRRSALEGEIKSEEHTNITAEADEPVTRGIFKPAGSAYYEINFTEVWPVHFESEKALIYSGRRINDLDISTNNLDWVSTSFRYSPELTSTKSLKMNLKQLNISLKADDRDVLAVEFLPQKSLSYKLEAFSSGLTGLSYRQTAPDMTTAISTADERFYGDYSLSAAITMSATNKNATRMA